MLRPILFLLVSLLVCDGKQLVKTAAKGWLRSGAAVTTHSCDFVRNVYDAPIFIRRLGHYVKYTEAYGIPVVGSHKVEDKALQRACYVLRFLLADRDDFRQLFYKNYGRVAVYASSEDYTDLPEFKLKPSVLIKKGVPPLATSTAAAVPESNLLCMLRDNYLPEDIAVRIIGRLMARFVYNDNTLHGIWQRAYDLNTRLKNAEFPKWKDTYATKSILGWVAEGTQSYFDVNYEIACPDTFHNYVNTRQELKEYDEEFYQIIRTMYPCGNKLFDRCLQGVPEEPRMNCPIKAEESNTTSRENVPRDNNTPAKLSDNGCKDMPWWNCAKEKRVRKDGCQGVMRIYCRKTCGTCSECRELDKLDHNPHCKKWAREGECQSADDPMATWYVRHLCRASCELD